MIAVFSANSSGKMGLRSISYEVFAPEFLLFPASSCEASYFFFSSRICVSMVIEGSISLSQSSNFSNSNSRLKVEMMVCSTRVISFAYFWQTIAVLKAPTLSPSKY